MLLNLPDFISLIGTIFSVSLAFSPIVPFTQVIRKKEKIDIIPEGMLISTTICRLLYLCIWTVKQKFIPIINAGLGVFISGSFLATFLYLYYQKCYSKFIAILIFLFILTISFGAGVLVQTEYKFDLGTLAMIFSVLRYISPGQKIGRVIKEKNYKLIPIWSTIASALCSGSWFFYGILINFLPSIVPNAIGLLFSIINTTIWVVFYLKRDKNEEGEEKEEKLNTEMKEI